MVSLFDKAREKLRRKDSDLSSRSSSLTRSSLSLSRKSKDKEKKSGLKFKNRLAQNSKESFSPSNSKRNSRIIVDTSIDATSTPKTEVSASESDQLAQKTSPDESVKTTTKPAPETVSEPAPEPQPEVEPEQQQVPEMVPENGTGTAVKSTEIVESPQLPNNTPIEPSVLTEEAPADPEEPPKTPDETLPLLVRAPPEIVETSSYLSSPLFSITVVVLLLLLLVGYFVYINAQTVITQSVHPQLNSVKIMAFTSQGLDVNVDLNVAINYTNISNPVYQHLFMAGGFLLSKMAFKPQLPVEIALNTMDSFNVTTPKQFVVGLRNGDVTSLNFNSTVQVSDLSMIKLLNDLLEKDQVQIHVKSKFKTDIGLRHIWLRNVRVSVDQDFIFVNNVNSQVEITNESFNLEDDKIEFKSLVKLNNPYLNDYVISESNFSVYLPDCADSLAKVGEIYASKWNMTTNNFSIRGLITEIPPELLKECEDGYSPLNRLAQAVMSQDKADLVLTCDSKHKDFPDWLNNIINNVKLRANGLPLSKFPTEFNYSIDAVDFQLDNQTLLSSNITLDVPVSMSRLKTQFSVEDYVSGSLTGELVNGVLSNTLELESMDRSVGELLSILAQGNKTKVKYQMSVGSVHVKSSLVDTTFKDLNMTGVSTVQGVDIEHLYDFVDIRVDQISHMKSDKHSVELLVKTVMSNPSNLSMDLARPVLLDVGYNGTKLVHVDLDKVYAPSNDDFAVEVRLRVEKNKHNEAFLTEFINKFVSGSDHIPYNVEFSCADEAVQFLNEIQLPTMEVPHVRFLDRETSTPFVLESTIHLIGSDVELEILNPIDNLDIQIELQEVIASYEGTQLGLMPNAVTIVAPPGISTTQRIPIKINAVGVDILKRAVNGKLAVMVDAKFGLGLGKLQLQLNYRGNSLESNIRL